MRRVASLEGSKRKNFIFEESSILGDFYDTNCFAVCWCVSVNCKPEVVVNPVVNLFTSEFDFFLLETTENYETVFRAAAFCAGK